MTTSEIIKLLLELAPAIGEAAKKVGFDLTKARREDLSLLILISHSQILQNHHSETMKVLQNQTQILNDIHSLLKKQGEDLAVLLKRTEK